MGFNSLPLLAQLTGVEINGALKNTSIDLFKLTCGMFAYACSFFLLLFWKFKTLVKNLNSI